jgi:hypothetical protein
MFSNSRWNHTLAKSNNFSHKSSTFSNSEKNDFKNRPPLNQVHLFFYKQQVSEAKFCTKKLQSASHSNSHTMTYAGAQR